MREILAREAQEIELGKRGENLACRVVFDISTWQKEYGEGVVQLIHQRNGDKTPYPCVVEADGGNAYWNITSADVDVAGRGHCELQYWVDEAIVKSATYITRTARSMSPASDTVPEPQKAWVDSVIQAGIDAVESAASAEAAAASAEASAEALAESERNAAISEQAAQDAASNAAASQTAAADSEAKAKLYANQCEASVSGVASFNGRGGHVMPQAGDYTAEMVGARSNTWMPTAADIGAVNPNMLHNWYFGDPVDQRGGLVVPPSIQYHEVWGGAVTGLTDKYYTAIHAPGGYDDQYQITVNGSTMYIPLGTCVRGYTGAGYTIDRWRCYTAGACISVTDTGLSIKQAAASGGFGQLCQSIEQSVWDDIRENNYSVTASILLADGTLKTKTGTVSGFGVLAIHGSSYFRFNTTYRGYDLIIIGDGCPDIIAVKLELGSVQTLAHQENGVWVLNEIPDKGEELVKCIQSTADASDTFANKTIATGHTCNRNLLDNWYFGNPVDQRGGYVVMTGTPIYSDAGLSNHITQMGYPGPVVERTSTYCKVQDTLYPTSFYYVSASDCVRGYAGKGYTVDRWVLIAGHTAAVLIENDGTRLICADSSDPTCFDIRIDAKSLRGKTVTFSALILGDGAENPLNISEGDGLAVNHADVSTSGKGLAVHTFVVTDNAETGVVRIWGRNGATGKIVAAKLELGTEQTLAHMEDGKWVLNEIPDKNEELLKCCMSTADPNDDYANNRKTPANVGALALDGSNAMTGKLKLAGSAGAVEAGILRGDDGIVDISIGRLSLRFNHHEFVSSGNKLSSSVYLRDMGSGGVANFLTTSNVPSAGNFIAGSYVGTGTVGVDGKNELTFPFEPKYVVVYQATGWNSVAFTFINPVKTINAGLPASSPQFSPTAEWSGKTLRWYLTGSLLNGGTEPQAGHQANTSGTTYYYAAWG